MATPFRLGDFFAFLLAALCAFSPAVALPPPLPPNVIIIFADDLGYGDLSCYGSKTIATPNLDKMAAEGMRLTDFHTCSPVCSPSRAALLTGSYAARIGLADHVLFPHARKGLSTSEITLAKLLKGKGYATGCIGKWHLGDAPQSLPTRQGFDSYFGIPYSNDMRIRIGDKLGAPLMRDEKIIEHPADQSTLTQRYTQEAIKFITANRYSPFFLYMPQTFPHVPLHISSEFSGKSKGGLYGDVVQCLDWSAGQVLETVDKLGIAPRTIVIFTSDNGPWLIKKEHGGSAGPLRDGKGTVYEGGHRVPCIVRWPGQIPPGAVCNEFATTMDFYPTLAKLTGATLPTDRVIDGKDIEPLLRGASGAKSPHEIFFHYGQWGELDAVRSGPWKMISAQPKKKNAPARALELYNLADDLGETRNVAAVHSDIVARLNKAREEHLAEMAKNSRPAGMAQADGSQRGDIPARGANDK